MKKKYFLIHFIFLTTFSHAAIYLGAQLGFSQLRMAHTFKDTTNPVIPLIASQNFKNAGLAYGLQLGFMLEPNKKYFGYIELAAVMGPSKTKKDIVLNSVTQATLSIQRTSSFGLVGGIGMRINPLVGFYGRVGIEFEKFKAQYTQQTFGKSPTYDKKISKVLIVPGLGVMFSFGSNVDLKIDYGYGIRKTVKLRDGNTVIDGESRAASVDMSENRFMLHINYKMHLG